MKCRRCPSWTAQQGKVARAERNGALSECIGTAYNASVCSTAWGDVCFSPPVADAASNKDALRFRVCVAQPSEARLLARSCGSGQNLVSEASNKFWAPQQEVLSCLAKKVPKEGAQGRR